MLYIHEELPLSDEELSRRQWAETLIDSDEEEGTEPENTMTGIETNFFQSQVEQHWKFFNIIYNHHNISLYKFYDNECYFWYQQMYNLL